MFLSAYETSAAKSYNIDPIIDELKDLHLEGQLHPLDTQRVLAVTEQNPQIKPFPHPIVTSVDFGGRDKKLQIYVDLRPYAKMRRDTGELKGGPELEYIKTLVAILDRLWIDGNARDLMLTGDLPARAYTNMLADNLGKRLQLDASITDVIRIVSAMFYYRLFHDYDEISQTNPSEYIKRIVRFSSVNVDDVSNVIEQIETPKDLAGMIQGIYEYTNSYRLEKLNVAGVYRLLGGIWFGPNATEQTAVALEHPPTWTAMVASALEHRGYQKTVLAKLLKTIDRRKDQSEHFLRNLRLGLRGD